MGLGIEDSIVSGTLRVLPNFGGGVHHIIIEDRD